MDVLPITGIPVVQERGEGLTLAQLNLARDFDRMLEDCTLVRSTGILPEAGGWNDQYDEFVQCWLIFYGESESAKLSKDPPE